MAQATPHNMQQPNTDVLEVLLQQQQQDDDATVCALLSASLATASVVHSTCSARLHAHMPRTPAAAPDRALAPGLCRWLAKHARLLHSLTLTISPYEELAVAAGLHAVTTAGQQQPAQPQPTQPQPEQQHASYGALLQTAAGPAGAAVMDAAGLAEHARQAAAKSPMAAAGPLPLAALHCRSPIEGGLLRSLAGGQLTSLQLTLQPTVGPRAGLIVGLANLTSLRVLGLAAQEVAAAPGQHRAQPAAAGGTAFVSSLALALGALTQLTELSLSGWVLLAQADVKHLPHGSLLRLGIGRRISASGGRALVPEPDDSENAPDEPLSLPHAPLDLSGLTHLTRLELSELCPCDKLPGGSLVELHVGAACSLKPVTTKGKNKLSSLRLLAIEDALPLLQEGNLKALARLPPSVTELRLGIISPFDAEGLGGGEFKPWVGLALDEEAATLLPRIKPLRQLHLTSFMLQPALLSKLGRCSQLTSLAFRECSVVRPGEDLQQVSWPTKQMAAQHMQGFAAQLRKLQQLQHLVLDLHGLRIEEEDDEIDSSADEARHFYGKDASAAAAGGGEPDDERDGGGYIQSRLGPRELQPLVDAIASLRHLTSLRVAWSGYGIPVMSAEQLATLAAVAPSS